ncbi:DUF397 domain-containing protein [Streptomyces iconiensis]|uniref:DUF397 domain-containing protein n=1 Tax=Streptomyces iconiensis TaxID=1384038 RepID=A0ABT7A3Z6_9ACTN|nr:DUF397 domain-containing protein [Streptomyces iconiensis]MDJ1136068.1 DUF397 domain-containing protein [Streptomyces iconiensis]
MENLTWVKSSFSSDEDAPNCVEVAEGASALFLRESEAPSDVLTLTPQALAGLLGFLK